MRCAVVRRIDPRRAALPLIAAALALSAVSFDRLDAGNTGPLGLIATATSTSLTLNWDVIYANHYNFDPDYEVKLGADGATTTVSYGTKSHTFTGLTAGASYTLYVRATAPEGSPGWHSNWNSLSATTALTSTSLTLIWHYGTYEVKLGADGATTTMSSGTSHTFTGLSLTAGTSYTLYVRPLRGDRDWVSLSATLPPAAPSDLSATAGDTSLTLSWTAVTGATGYEVKLGADGAATAVSSGTSHTFSSLTANTSYTLYSRAKNSGGVSDWSSLSATTALAAPSGLSATATNTSLTLSWTAVSDATGYEVKLGVDGAVATPSGLSHTFSDLTAGTEYTLYARAKNSGGTSDWSSLTAATVPAAPSGLSATATNTSLTLSWTAVTGATSYEVKRGASSAMATVSSGASHSFSGLTASTEYTLYARAKNSGGVSDWSSLTATTMALPTPGGLRITRQSGVILELAWDRVAGATSYEVKRVAGTAETIEPNAGCCSVRFLDATAGTTYTFTVRARNSSGISSWSAALSATAGLPTPTGLNAAATSSSLTLSWSAVTSATSYEVKQGASGTVTTVSSGISHAFSGLTAYEVRQGASGTVTAMPSGVSHTFASLTANTSYTLYVRAKNSDGTSPWSSISATTSPAAPSSLSVTTTLSSLTLSWGSVTGATSYEVKQSSGTVTAVSSGTSHTFSDLNGGTEYTLYVRAKNSDGTSDWSSISATTSPAAPSSLSVTTTLSSLTLSWGSVTGATSYEVKQGASGAVTAASSGTNHMFTGLTANTSYTLYVRAKNSAGVSAWAPVNATAKLATPTGLRSSGFDSGSLYLRLDAVTGATSYEVKQGASGTVTTLYGPYVGSYYQYGMSPSSHWGYGYNSMWLPESAKTHTLYVRAKNSEGASAWNTVTGRFCNGVPWDGIDGSWGRGREGSYRYSTSASPPQTPAPWPPLPAPSKGGCLRVTAESPTSLTLTWVYRNPDGYPTQHPKSFEVKLGESGAVTTVLPGAMRSLWSSRVTWTGSHTFTGLTLGTEYVLYVRLKDQGGGSPSPWFSVTGTTWFDGVTAAPATPSGLSVTATSGSLALGWGGVAGATSYEVKLNADGKVTVPSGTSHTFNSLVGGTQHALYVRAKNSGGWSDWSSINATTTAGTLAAPGGLSVTVADADGNVTFSWGSVSGAASYEVTTLSFTGMPITVSGTSHVFATRARDSRYTLYVRAKNRSETSPWSSISGTIPSE